MSGASSTELRRSSGARLSKRHAIVVALTVAVAAFVVYQLPFLYDVVDRHDVNFNGSYTIAVISDLHIESNKRDLSCIAIHLSAMNVTHLIVNGDLFDDKHSSAIDANMIKYAIDRLNLHSVRSLRMVVIVLSLYNHDPIASDSLTSYRVNDMDVLVVRGLLRIHLLNTTLNVVHGDYIVRNGIIATLLNQITFGPTFERMARRVLGLDEREWIVLGHTHIPAFSADERIANTGSWISRFSEPSDTMLVVSASKSSDELSVKYIRASCG